ncbi:hypothetical protein F5Y16DRAFT_268441 [Xylariaceae sp. FL0255]|nr:hypothetical protein F5Y16DRAFT_268441 [Xylariaceae sp. FL0255]
MAEPFNRKAFAQTFLGLNIPETESSLMGGESHHLKTSKKTNRPAIRKRNSILLKLPAEIRLQIYDLLLVSQLEPFKPSLSVRRACQGLVQLDSVQTRQYRIVDSAVVQICKQIYYEAVATLYSQNVFSFSNPKSMLRLLSQIGHENIKLIKALDIYVPPDADRDSWLKLFRLLSDTATGLKSVVVRWWRVARPWQPSLGKDIGFAQALARLLKKVGVEKLRIEGYYAQPWPAFFRDKLGAGIVEEDYGRSHPPGDDEAGWKRKVYEDHLKDFRRYQNGTELLNPWEEEASDEE